MLLGLALLGYGGLPSNPPSGLQAVAVAGTDAHAGREGLLAPTQAKEHRSRDSLAEPEPEQPDDRLPAILPTADAASVSPFRHAEGVPDIRPEIAIGSAYSKSSRAPPVLRMI